MNTETYGRSAGLLYGQPESAWNTVFSREGVQRSDWESAWGRISHAMQNSADAAATYTAAFRAGLEEQARSRNMSPA